MMGILEKPITATKPRDLRRQSRLSHCERIKLHRVLKLRWRLIPRMAPRVYPQTYPQTYLQIYLRTHLKG
jgi:hypothetical protein